MDIRIPYSRPGRIGRAPEVAGKELETGTASLPYCRYYRTPSRRSVTVRACLSRRL